MKGPFRIFRRCCFCRKKDDLKFVNAYGGYGEVGWFYAYHESCLNEVLCSPETHTHGEADLAIEIVDNIKYWKKRDEDDKERARQSCEYLKKACTELQEEMDGEDKNENKQL